jgi:hypothetical protein
MEIPSISTRRAPGITEFLIRFRSRCACYTCNYAYTAIPRIRKIPENIINRIQALRDLEVRATVIFTSKIHALNTLKMAPLLTGLRLWCR